MPNLTGFALIYCPQNHRANDGLQWFRCAYGPIVCTICGEKIPQPRKTPLTEREIREMARDEADMVYKRNKAAEIHYPSHLSPLSAYLADDLQRELDRRRKKR